MDKLNGHYDLHHFKDAQEQRFESLESVLKQGFQGVTAELKALREQGYIPVSVVEKMHEQQKNLIHPVIRLLCTALVLTLLWFTGLKAALPHIFNVQ
jgi:hypothetical protein